MRILIVEDERKMAEVLKKGLEEQGHSVTLAHTGTEGLALAQTLSFEAMVLDIMLPGFDGFEVARRLRKGENGTPILILTARDGEADIVRGLNLGADDYLTKPFSFVEFVARLHAVSRLRLQDSVPGAQQRRSCGRPLASKGRTEARDYRNTRYSVRRVDPSAK